MVHKFLVILIDKGGNGRLETGMDYASFLARSALPPKMSEGLVWWVAANRLWVDGRSVEPAEGRVY